MDQIKISWYHTEYSLISCWRRISSEYLWLYTEEQPLLVKSWMFIKVWEISGKEIGINFSEVLLLLCLEEWILLK